MNIYLRSTLKNCEFSNKKSSLYVIVACVACSGVYYAINKYFLNSSKRSNKLMKNVPAITDPIYVKKINNI